MSESGEAWDHGGGLDDPLPDAKRWVSVYDPASGVCVLAAAANAGNYWTSCTLDPAVSSPDGEFEVFVRAGTRDPVMARVKLGDQGPILLHRDFNDYLLSSPTVWGHHAAFEFPILWWNVGRFWMTKAPPECFVAAE